MKKIIRWKATLYLTMYHIGYIHDNVDGMSWHILSRLAYRIGYIHGTIFETMLKYSIILNQASIYMHEGETFKEALLQHGCEMGVEFGTQIEDYRERRRKWLEKTIGY